MYYTFGSNFGSQLAQPDDIDETHDPLILSIQADKIVAGVMHNLVLYDGKVYSYGCNDEYALGRGGSEEKILEVRLKGRIKDISCGASHSAALNDKGCVYAWGTFRDLGGVSGFDFNTKFQHLPKLISRNIASIVSTENQIIMVSTKGSVVCYGSVPKAKNRERKERAKFKIRVRRWEIMRHGKNKPKFCKLVTGSNHCLAISEKGDTFGWGSNSANQLGFNDNRFRHSFEKIQVKNVKMCAAGLLHSLFLTHKNELFGCGENVYGQLGNLGKCNPTPVKIDNNFTGIWAAENNTMGLQKNKLIVGGGNFHGELGIKPGIETKVFQILEHKMGEIKNIVMGSSHTIVETNE